MRLPWHIRQALLFSFNLLLISIISAWTPAAKAEVVRADDGTIASELNLPVYEWKEQNQTPIAVVIAIHGMAMHGGSFDTLGKSLASRGFLFIAPDLRGYGRWHSGNSRFHDKSALNYQQSLNDLLCLTQKVHSLYPNLPIFLAGESLGGALALQVAGRQPELVSGLILCSPAIKRRLVMLPRTILQAPVLMTNLGRQLDLIPYIKHCASDDPRVIKEIIDDPFSRKTMSTWELLASLNTMKATLSHIKEIPPSMPVLIIQGSADRALKANAVVVLLSRLRSTDQTVKWFPQRGHVLIETAYLRPPTLEIVEGWLHQHTQQILQLGSATKEARKISLDY